MERSFSREVEALRLGDGATFRGEGILAVTKPLLQSGVSYVGGYQGAPVSHLLDVMVEAKDLLAGLGVHVETCTNEAAAAAMLGASINYPLRGAVTWKSIVGTNVAGRRAVEPRLAGRNRRRADRPRRGLWRGCERHPGTLLRLCNEVVDLVARSAARSADYRPHGGKGFRTVRSEPCAGHARFARARLPCHWRVCSQRQQARPLQRARSFGRPTALRLRPVVAS